MSYPEAKEKCENMNGTFPLIDSDEDLVYFNEILDKKWVITNILYIIWSIDDISKDHMIWAIAYSPYHMVVILRQLIAKVNSYLGHGFKQNIKDWKDRSAGKIGTTKNSKILLGMIQSMIAKMNQQRYHFISWLLNFQCK